MKYYFVPLYFFSDQILIIRNKLIYIFRRKSPSKWARGNKGDIVLIQGLHQGWVLLQTIGNHLNKLGFRIHVISGLGSNTVSVKDGCEIISKYITGHNLNGFTLITHSKGGIEALYLLKDPNVSRKVDKVITIACPYSGTILAHIYPSSKELAPSSDLIRNDLINVDLDKIVNIYPKLDNHVIPNDSLVLKRGKNITIDIVGHNRILESKSTLDQIERVLNK